LVDTTSVALADPDSAQAGVVALLADWSVYGLVASAVIGFVLQQSPLDPVGGRKPEIRHRAGQAGRGAVELWAGHLDEAARVFDSGAAAAAASGGEDERASCLGHFALVEALRGRLSRAAELAVQATAAAAAGEQRPGVQRPNPAALAALAWVHLEHNELRRARSRLKQVDAAWALARTS